uniref:Uncharacterized protein n=1 Tax=Romanomermis culicivorax TaxID=13658 RepID=A0A915HX22_ROMCU
MGPKYAGRMTVSRVFLVVSTASSKRNFSTFGFFHNKLDEKLVFIKFNASNSFDGAKDGGRFSHAKHRKKKLLEASQTHFWLCLKDDQSSTGQSEFQRAGTTTLTSVVSVLKGILGGTGAVPILANVRIGVTIPARAQQETLGWEPVD